jgi:hypothetical protein
MTRAGAALLVFVGLALGGCAPAVPPLDDRQVEQWIDVLYPLPKAERLSPPVASRLHGYAGLALYEGLHRADPTYRSLGGQLPGLAPFPEPEGAHDWPVVAAELERQVLTGLIEGFAQPSTRVMVDTIAEAQIRRRVDAGVSDDVVDRSMEYAGVVAALILARAASDGFGETRAMAYDPPVGPGLWVNTTSVEEYAPISVSASTDLVRLSNPSAALVPGSANARQLVLDRPSGAGEVLPDIDPTAALEPYWGRVATWALPSSEACAPPPPIEYSERPGSPFWEQVDAVYRASVTLSEEERTIALHWADNPGNTGTPPGHWVSILRQLVGQLELSPLEAAETFALTGLGLADAFVSAWDEKYRSNVVRPVTFIRGFMDSSWETVVVTPPFPEYTSGHSVVSGAAGEILTSLLGDGRSFLDSTHVSSGIAPRRYASFRDAADEASISRLYGGIHYPMAIEAGKAQGVCVARALLDRVSTRVDGSLIGAN